MRKLITMALAILMLASFALPVFAEGEIKLNITNAPDSTNISINGSEVKAYKLFDVSKDGSSYAYFLATQFNTEKAKTILGIYFDFQETLDGRINVIPKDTCTEDNKLAMAKDFVDKGLLTGMIADAAAVGASETAALTLPTKGYYLVTASGKSSETGNAVQSVLMMDTMTATKNIAIKASAPKLDKNIKKNETTPVKAASFNVGDSVPFEITVALPSMLGYSTYSLKITDTLSTGLTVPAAGSISVKVDGEELALEKTVTVDGQVITVTIPEAITLKDKTVTVSYSAVLNSKAVTTTAETNTVNLEYSNNPYNKTEKGQTPPVINKVYNFDVVIDKYAGAADATDTTKKLANAKFVLAKITETGTDGKPVYAYYRQDATAKTVTWVSGITDDMIVTTDNTGKASFAGIEAGTYYLIEKEAPLGYNMLKDPVTVTVTAVYAKDGGIDTSSEANTVTLTNTRWGVTQSVANQPGRVLPSTGGMGTTLFYVLGSLLALGSGILLVTKRRMNRN